MRKKRGFTKEERKQLKLLEEESRIVLGIGNKILEDFKEANTKD